MEGKCGYWNGGFVVLVVIEDLIGLFYGRVGD